MKAIYAKRCLLPIAGAVFTVVGIGFLHPDDPKVRDTEPRYEGPGYRRDANMPQNPHGFDAQNVELLSWLPIGEFGNHSQANDCWGYVSGTGREYAIIGLSRGTGFVDITDPGNAQIVTVMPGPGDTTWRDIKIYQDHAYAVSEAGDGIQVFDLSQIDSGTVTHVRNVTTGGSNASHNVALNEDSGYLYRTGGSGHGLRIYDLADPSNPSYVTTFSDRYVHDAQVVSFTEGQYAGREIAFCCAGFNNGWDQTGLWIVDVTDKQNVFTISHTQYSNNVYSHQGWLSEDRQYFYQGDELDEGTYGNTTKTRIFDVSNLSSPSLVTEFTNGSAAIDHNIYVRGNLIFEANYRSGLRVYDATNPTAPVEIGYFDTYPDNDNANYNGLWSNYPLFPSGTIIGSDRERGLFVWRLESSAADITDLVVDTGTLLDGDISSLIDSDDNYVHTQSGFGQTLVDLHNMEMTIVAESMVDGASTINLSIESRIDEPSGTAQVYMKNFNTNDFDLVGSYTIGNSDGVEVINGIDASTYYNASNGRVRVKIKHIVFVPFLAFTFESYVDQVEIVVQ